MKIMSLIDKIKKGLGTLGVIGVLGSPVYNSGCEALVLGLAIKSAGDAQAEATIEAARIQNENSSPSNYASNLFIIANSYRGDLNGNKIYDLEEFDGVKNVFRVPEPIILVSVITKRNSTELKVTSYEKQNNEWKFTGKKEINIVTDPFEATVKINTDPSIVGTYRLVQSIGEEILSDIIFEIQEYKTIDKLSSEERISGKNEIEGREETRPAYSLYNNLPLGRLYSK